ncbi:PIN domain-containing protein [Filimonas effusa]|nr:PIN domain-containing protein [Filimonas effusa]
MNRIFVIDTVALINYYNIFFHEKDMLSPNVRNAISKCLDRSYDYFKLIIPSVVFVEIYKNFLRSEEMARKFYYEIFIQLKECEDVEIKPIEQEIVSLLLDVDSERTLELHDKIIYASAVQMECTLITNDPKIIKANKRDKFIPEILF